MKLRQTNGRSWRGKNNILPIRILCKPIYTGELNFFSYRDNYKTFFPSHCDSAWQIVSATFVPEREACRSQKHLSRLRENILGVSIESFISLCTVLNALTPSFPWHLLGFLLKLLIWTGSLVILSFLLKLSTMKPEYLNGGFWYNFLVNKMRGCKRVLGSFLKTLWHRGGCG